MPLVIDARGEQVANPSYPKKQKPDLPSLEQSRQKASRTVNQARQRALSSYKPVEVPTFSANYYMPQSTLNRINAILNQDPQLKKKQLKKRAKTNVNLLTNPQIETLREQINELKKLRPEIRQQITQNYGEAQHQLSQNTQNLIAQILETVRAEDGLRPGVATAVSHRAQQADNPLSDVLEENRQLDIATILENLNVQKENAQNLLRTIRKNKDDMTKVRYNELKDQATEQWRQAQQAQLKFLRSIADVESSARQTAADIAQNRAIAQNELMEQVLQTRLGSLDSLQENLMRQLDQQYNAALNQWLDYLTGPSVPSATGAMNLLQRHRAEIEEDLGVEGFMALHEELSNYNPGWQNPNYRPPTGTSGVSNPRAQRTDNLAAYQGIADAYSRNIASNPVERGVANILGNLFSNAPAVRAGADFYRTRVASNPVERGIAELFGNLFR